MKIAYGNNIGSKIYHNSIPMWQAGAIPPNNVKVEISSLNDRRYYNDSATSDNKWFYASYNQIPFNHQPVAGAYVQNFYPTNNVSWSPGDDVNNKPWWIYASVSGGYDSLQESIYFKITGAAGKKMKFIFNAWGNQTTNATQQISTYFYDANNNGLYIPELNKSSAFYWYRENYQGGNVGMYVDSSKQEEINDKELTCPNLDVFYCKIVLFSRNNYGNVVKGNIGINIY